MSLPECLWDLCLCLPRPWTLALWRPRFQSVFEKQPYLSGKIKYCKTGQVIDPLSSEGAAAGLGTVRSSGWMRQWVLSEQKHSETISKAQGCVCASVCLQGICIILVDPTWNLLKRWLSFDHPKSNHVPFSSPTLGVSTVLLRNTLTPNHSFFLISKFEGILVTWCYCH